jgi:hypothetical protein
VDLILVNAISVINTRECSFNKLIKLLISAKLEKIGKISHKPVLGNRHIYSHFVNDRWSRQNRISGSRAERLLSANWDRSLNVG